VKTGSDRADSLFWLVEQQLADLQFRVAASHAKRGNAVVILTNRSTKGADRMSLEQDYGDDAASRMTVLSTKRS
jgi:hypothetical protein